MLLPDRKKIFLASAAVLFVAMQLLDWSALLLTSTASAWSFIPKYLTTLLCALFVWSSARDAWQAQDGRLIRLAFGFILAGDTFLVLLPGLKILPYPPLFGLGVLAFICTQTLLVIRFARLWPEEFRTSRESGTRHQFLWFVLTGVLLVLLYTLELYFIYPDLQENPFVTGLVVYLFILTLSCWVGIGTIFQKGSYPRWNARLVLGAMVFFFGTELFDGLMLASPDGSWNRKFFDILIWVCYAPTIILLALSSVRRVMKVHREKE